MSNSLGQDKKQSGLDTFLTNIKQLPQSFKDATVRHGPRSSNRAASQSVFSNLFLHIHSVRTHRYNFKKTFTVGLGVASAAAFIILTITGVLLMIYYKPSLAQAQRIQFVSSLIIAESSSENPASCKSKLFSIANSAISTN